MSVDSSVRMNAAESSIAMDQPIRIRSGPQVRFKRFHSWYFRNDGTIWCVSVLLILAGLLGFWYALLHHASVPPTEVPPTAGTTVADRGRMVGPKVVGGEEAKPNDWPWQISLQILHDGRFHHFCGASLINELWAMTAAHCVDGRPGYDELRAVVGEHDLTSVSGREQMVRVAEVHIHPNWTGSLRNGNDIALLRFDSNVTLNQWVQPATLPPAGQILPHNTTCYVTGWGYTDAGYPDRLMQAYLPLVDHETCSRPDWWGWMESNMVCAGGNGIQGGCYGDSGGPLSCDVNGTRVVHGVASWTVMGCKQPKKPTVFARVSAHIDWMIDQIVN